MGIGVWATKKGVDLNSAGQSDLSLSSDRSVMKIEGKYDGVGTSGVSYEDRAESDTIWIPFFKNGSGNWYLGSLTDSEDGMDNAGIAAGWVDAQTFSMIPNNESNTWRYFLIIDSYNGGA
jgi:hypothetical protein